MDWLGVFRKVPFVLPLIRGKKYEAPKEKSVSLFGLNFPNKVGLAAGFDKDARWIDDLSELGFGFIEID